MNSLNTATTTTIAITVKMVKFMIQTMIMTRTAKWATLGAKISITQRAFLRQNLRHVPSNVQDAL